MCGRYAFYYSPQDLKNRLGLENLINYPERYNCAPMQSHPIIVKGRLGFGRWGFRPSWAKVDDKSMAAKMTNARSESVHEKPAFRETWQKQRLCIIPANGFYEWVGDGRGGKKQPYFISDQSSDLVLMVGLWSKVENEVTFTILTKQADDPIKNLHHRMPVMIGQDDIGSWFSGDSSRAGNLIEKASACDMGFHKVGFEVGKVSNDDKSLVAPLDDQKLSA